LDQQFLVRLPVLARTLSFATTSQISYPRVKQRRPSNRVTFSMGHAGANMKSPNDTAPETLSQGLRRLISAPLLTAILSWRHEKEDFPVGPPCLISISVAVCVPDHRTAISLVIRCFPVTNLSH